MIIIGESTARSESGVVETEIQNGLIRECLRVVVCVWMVGGWVNGMRDCYGRVRDERLGIGDGRGFSL